MFKIQKTGPVSKFEPLFWLFAFLSVARFPSFPLELINHYTLHLFFLSFLFYIKVDRKRRLLTCLIQLFLLYRLYNSLSVNHSADFLQNRESLNLYCANILVGNSKVEKTLQFLEESDYDVVVLIETWPELHQRLNSLKRFPYRVYLEHPLNFSLAVLSRTEIQETARPSYGHREIPWLELYLPHWKFHLFAIHAPPPMNSRWLEERDKVLHLAASRLASKSGLLAGDFNLTPYAPLFQDLIGVHGLKSSRPMSSWKGTWPSFLGPFGIPIDHILTTSDILTSQYEVNSIPGSDHHSISLRVQLAGSDEQLLQQE